MARWCSEEVLDDTHLCIKSLRNSSDALHRFAELHIMKSVVYADPTGADGDRSVFWSALGVPATMLEFVLVVDSRWDFERKVLRVRESLEHDAEGLQRLAAVVGFFLQWRNWSDTRWAGVGPAARLFVASLFIGLDALVALVDHEGINNDKYFLGAARKRLTVQVREYIVIASLACYPVEGLTLSLLEDDRFLFLAQGLWQELKEEELYVSSLPSAVWSALAVAIGEQGYDGQQLRDDTVSSMRVAIAYVDRNLYAPLRQYPLSLTQGDISANLKEFAAQDPANLDLVSKKIHCCMQFVPAQVYHALRLLADTAWGISLVEKGHAAGAFVKRHHRTLGQAQLELRAFVNDARPLFRLGRDAVSENDLRGRFEGSLAAARRVRCSVSNFFCSRLISEARAAAGLSAPRDVSRHCIAGHNRRFQAMPLLQRCAMEAEAARVRQAQSDGKIDDAREAHAQLALLERRRMAAEKEGDQM